MDTERTEFLLTGRHVPFTNYRDYIRALAKRLGFTTPLPTLTNLRKYGATEIAAMGAPELQEKVAEHMSHLPSTSAQHYRSRFRHAVTAEVTEKIREVMCKIFVLA